MKKFSFVVALALVGTMGAFAQGVKVNQLNPYAYGVKAEVEEGVVAITYSLNAPATAAEIVIYKDGQEVRTQACSSTTTGLAAEVVDLSEETVAGKYTFGIRVHGNSVESPTCLMEVLEGSTDTTIVNYAFYHPKGVDIDVNPYSENFGRIITNEAMEAPAEGYHSSGYNRGLYAFDPTFAPIPNGNSRVYTGGINFDANYSPYRIRISKDSRIFVSDERENLATSLYEVSADLQTWTPVFTGSYEDGVMSDANGNYMVARNSGFDVVGEGENLQILMLNFSTTGAGGYTPSGFFVDRYDLGTATTWTAAPSQHDTLAAISGDACVPVFTNCGISSDGQGGFWFKSARANVVDQRGFFHANAQGVVDFEFHATAADTLAYGIHTNGSNGGAGVRQIGEYVYVGMGRRKSGHGHLEVYQVGTGAAGEMTLTRKYDLDIPGISTNLNDFAVDYAGNLYTVGNSNEKIVAVMLPYSGIAETPVAAEIEVVESAVEEIESAPVVNKVIENGQVIVIKNGVRYNVLGAQL